MSVRSKVFQQESFPHLINLDNYWENPEQFSSFYVTCQDGINNTSEDHFPLPVIAFHHRLKCPFFEVTMRGCAETFLFGEIHTILPVKILSILSILNRS